jgi:hypothetical protein
MNQNHYSNTLPKQIIQFSGSNPGSTCFISLYLAFVFGNNQYHENF